MLNTYINDNSNVPYPFYGMERLPFDLHCIIGLNIAILELPNIETYAYCIKPPLYASTINIKDNEVSVDLCDSADTLLCTVTSKGECNVYDEFMLYNDKPIINAKLHKGIYKHSSTGTFTGKFWIDPSCINHIDKAVYGNYSKLKLNGVSYKIGKVLSLSITGLMQQHTNDEDEVVLSITNTARKEELCNSLQQYKEHPMINNINGVSVRTKDTTNMAMLRIIVDPYVTDINIDSLLKKSTIICAVNGTASFPSCYDVDDEAKEVPCYEC